MADVVQKACLLHHCLEEDGVCKECFEEFGIDSFRLWLADETRPVEVRGSSILKDLKIAKIAITKAMQRIKK